MRSADLRRAVVRVRIVGFAMFAGFALLGVRAAHLSLADDRAQALAPRQTQTVLHLAPARGSITDRSGAELAITVPAPSVYAVPKQVQDPVASARSLARVLGVSAPFLEKRLRLGGGFVYLARWIDRERATAIEALALPGIGLITEPRRTYPQGSLAGRLVGFANVDGAGVRGIEQSEDEWLQGHAERIAVQRDARGRILAFAGHDPRGAAGGDVALTLDAALQAEAEAALADTVLATGAAGGFVIALDPSSGDLLALAEAPAFDPNQFRRARYPETRARMFTDAFEPGSTFKPFLVAAALERRAISASDRFDCENGSWRVPGKTLRDTHEHGLLDPAGILRVSSNIGAAKIGYELGRQEQHEMLAALGFGSRTGSGFPDESPGILRSWRAWRPVDHATISFGQGVSVTALQLAAAGAALANGGILRAPRMVAARRAPGGVWQPTAPSDGRRVLREEVARQVLGMLEGVVHRQGTAVRASLEGVRAAGKTGTAQPLDPITHRYASNRYLGWFVGSAPVEAPRIVVVAMVEDARGVAHTGGSTAAPLFARVAAAALARQGLRTQAVFSLPEPAFAGWTPAAGVPSGGREVLARWPTSRPEVGRALLAAQAPEPPPEAASPAAIGASATALPSVSAAQESAAQPAAAPVAQVEQRVLVPDFRGLSLAEVKRITDGLPVSVELQGSGTAVAQEPDPGSVLSGGSALVLVHFSPAAQ